METIFEFRRHSVKDGPDAKMIGPMGYRLAREVGRRQLRGRGFSHFFASPIYRTHQTLAAFAEGAGDFRLIQTPSNAPIYAPHPDTGRIYATCWAAEQRGEDLVAAALAAHYDLVATLAETAADIFETWCRVLPRGARVLVIGHSPEMEFLPLGLKSVRLASLRFCQGFRIGWDGQTYRIDALAPDLDPSGIHREIARASI